MRACVNFGKASAAHNCCWQQQQLLVFKCGPSHDCVVEASQGESKTGVADCRILALKTVEMTQRRTVKFMDLLLQEGNRLRLRYI